MELNEIMYQKSYQEYKAELDQELGKTAEGFVKIGYLLKVARDTNVLAESPYSNVVDFAKAEYGIDKTQVSRFIHINDKFSEGGYSDHLMQNYQGFGYAKLTLMLQLPDEINEELSPSYTKSEIQAIKDEVDEENKVTDIERMLENENLAVAAVESNDIYSVIAQLGEDEPALFVEIHKRLEDEHWTIEDFKEVMAPQGEKIYSVRIRGIGRMMLSLKDTEDRVQLINIRTGEKKAYGWGTIGACWEQLMNMEKSAEENWTEVYGAEFPQKDEIAPVQQQPASKKETRVTKARPEKKAYQPETPPKQMTLHEVSEEIPEPAPVPEEPEKENVVADSEYKECEEQLEGQTSIENDFPEYLPEVTESSEPDAAGVAEVRESSERVIAGYKAGITSAIKRLENLAGSGSWGELADTAKDIQWRAEQILKMEGK